MSGYNKLLRSLTKSTDKPVKALVKGAIPSWVNGTLFRNGPGRFKFGNNTYEHLFDGQACVHKFKVENGEVYYSNKLLETKSYLKTLERGKLFPNFGTVDAGSNIFSRFKTFFNPPDTSDNVNVNVAPYAHEHLYALTESNFICKLDPDDLEITDSINVSKYLSNLKSTIAHPHIERDGTWITMGINSKGDRGVNYEFVRFRGGEKGAKSKHALEQAEVIASIPSSNKSGFAYFHSFGLTDNYIIFLEQCLQISYKDVIIGLIKNKPRSSALITYPDMPTRVHIINKHTGKTVNKKFITDPQFTFHYINAYETENSELILDMSSYDSKHFNIEAFTFENMYSGSLMETDKLRAVAKRLTIPLNKKENEKNEVYCELKTLNNDLPFELPIINYWRHNGKKYKYVYGANHYKNPLSIIKLNVDSPNEVLKFEYPNGCLPMEPIFVENVEPKHEDDGVLLVMVLSEKNDFLSVLDARNLTELARAEIPEDVRGAMTFHGFFADKMSFSKLN